MQLNLLKKKFVVFLLLLITLPAFVKAQKTVTGSVTNEKDGSPLSNVSVTAKGSKVGTKTATDGSFSITVADAISKLNFSSVGFGQQEITISGSTINVILQPINEGLTEVVVIGYGTARKKDLTGAVGSVSAKNFNKGVLSSPDQLIQGKVAGVQVLANNGAPGAGTTIRIRGNSSIRSGSTPLFVIDGVPLQNTNTRPDIGLTADIGGGTPSGNPLNFINPSDIASMDVLKDASAAAIYGSRGANGVVLITTKKGQAGVPKVDFNTSVGFSKIANRIDVLNGDQYRDALTKAGITTGNFGANTDALGAILRTGFAQNYGVAVSAGTENARYRFSLGYQDQEGIIKKTDYKKYAANFSSTVKMLDSKKLAVDFNVITSQSVENIAPISSTAGFKGSLIGQALQWNPTRSLFKANSDSLFIDYGSSDINPLAYSRAYNDKAKVTTALVSVAPSYKLTKNLEAKTQLSINYATGTRKQYTTAQINIQDINVDQTLPSGDINYQKGGEINVSQNELVTKQITNTLSFVDDLSSKISLNAVVGHEYIKTDFGGNSLYARRLITGTDRPLYYYASSSNPSTRVTNGFQDPTTELQSFFARTIFNINEKYVITATARADGSSKFGKNNRYGFFPSIAAGWNVSKEDFLKNITAVENVRIRASYGVTGNQEFPAASAQETYVLIGSPGSFDRNQIENPDLSWEETKSTNFGLDFSVAKGRVNFSFDYFNKNTTKILFPVGIGDPGPRNNTVKWTNIDGNIINKGLEASVNANLIRKNDFSLDLGINATFQSNTLKNFKGEIPTGEVNGQGLSGAFAQLLKNGYPLNTFYLKKFTGIDKTTGISTYEGGEQKFFLGSANPKTLLGLTLNAAYKKVALEVSMNGAFGHYIYNNTANAILAYNNLGKRNIGVSEFRVASAGGEKTVNPTSASSRYLEKGDYLRLSNASLTYNLGKIGKNIRSANVFINGQNLFVITKFTGFDPEVNVSKPLNNVPSFGMEYTPYPSARTVNFGFNLSL